MDHFTCRDKYQLHFTCPSKRQWKQVKTTLLRILTFCWPCISVMNQPNAQKFCFTISLFHASTCFEHMCSSSGGQNCITQPLVSSQFWPPDDEHMCSKHVQAWNKLIVKQTFCAESWLITEINAFYGRSRRTRPHNFVQCGTQARTNDGADCASACRYQGDRRWHLAQQMDNSVNVFVQSKDQIQRERERERESFTDKNTNLYRNHADYSA